jgi:hypothetical protein
MALSLCFFCSLYCWRTRRLLAAEHLSVFDVMSDGDIGKVRKCSRQIRRFRFVVWLVGSSTSIPGSMSCAVFWLCNFTRNLVVFFKYFFIGFTKTAQPAGAGG